MLYYNRFEIKSTENRVGAVIAKLDGFTGLGDFQTKFGDFNSRKFVKDLISATGAKKAVTFTKNEDNSVTYGVGGLMGGAGSIIVPEGKRHSDI